jgi:spermidine synthase
MINFVLSTAFLVSGACGLIYQTVWIRKFTLVFGSTLPAASAVISVFFLGLGLGSWLFGRLSVSSKKPGRLYALCECAISVYALAFPLILSAAEACYGWLYPSVSTRPALIGAVRIGIALLTLIVPAVLMGGTLPLLVRHFVRRVDTASLRAGALYGLNALGAAGGCLLSGYFLFQTIGVNRTNTLTAGVNLVAAFLVLLATTRIGAIDPGRETESETGRKRSQDRPRTGMVVLVCFAVSGFVSMAYELTWLRYLLFYFRDTSYLYSGITAVFITGIAVGSLAFRHRLLVATNPFMLFGFLQVSIGVFTVLAVFLPIPWHEQFFEAAERSRLILLGLLFLLLLLSTIAMGGTFPAIVRMITTNAGMAGRDVGRAYALNTAGGILGTLAGGFLLFPLLGLHTTVYLLFTVNIALGMVIFATGSGRRYFRVIPVAACLLLPACLSYGFHGRLPDLLVSRISRGEQVLQTGEGVTGTSWATSSPQGMKLLENRVVISRTGPGSFPIQGYIPIVLAPHVPKSVLGLCFGGGVSSHAGTLFPEVKRFDFVDISRQNIRIALNTFPHNRGLKTDPRVRFIIDDAYSFVKYSRDQYDLITMDPNPPTLSFRCAVLYTKDFYELARARLTDTGYFSQVLPLDHFSEAEMMSAMKTFSAVFEHTILWWNGVDPVMIGSRNPFSFDLREISERLERPAVAKYVAEHSAGAKYHLMGYFLSGFLLTDEGFRRVAQGGGVLTSDLTHLEFSTGGFITPAGVERIGRNLSTITEIKNVMAYAPGFDSHGEQIESQRSYLLKMLYSMIVRLGSQDRS